MNELRIGYMSMYLQDLARLDADKDIYKLVNLLTSIDRSIFKQSWMKLYKKSKKAIEFIESSLMQHEISERMLESLYFTAYIAISSAYVDSVKMTIDERLSMEEFLATVRDIFDDRFHEVMEPPTAESSYKRMCEVL